MGTVIDLEAIRARAEAASSGPWTSRADVHGAPIVSDTQTEGFVTRCWKSHPKKNENATFIAHAREDIPALLAEIDRLREVVNAAAWQFNEAVSMLREGAPFVRSFSTRADLADEIGERLPAIQAALESLSAAW